MSLLDLFAWIVLHRMTHVIHKVLLRQIAILNYVNPF